MEGHEEDFMSGVGDFILIFIPLSPSFFSALSLSLIKCVAMGVIPLFVSFGFQFLRCDI